MSRNAPSPGPPAFDGRHPCVKLQLQELVLPLDPPLPHVGVLHVNPHEVDFLNWSQPDAAGGKVIILIILPRESDVAMGEPFEKILWVVAIDGIVIIDEVDGWVGSGHGGARDEVRKRIQVCVDSRGRVKAIRL